VDAGSRRRTDASLTSARRYSYDDSTDTISNDFIIAGNNGFPTKGVSNSALTGRQ
jgi:hypothetical protein